MPLLMFWCWRKTFMLVNFNQHATPDAGMLVKNMLIKYYVGEYVWNCMLVTSPTYRKVFTNKLHQHALEFLSSPTYILSPTSPQPPKQQKNEYFCTHSPCKIFKCIDFRWIDKGSHWNTIVLLGQIDISAWKSIIASRLNTVTYCRIPQILCQSIIDIFHYPFSIL